MQFKEPRHNPNKPIIRAIIFTWLHPFLCCFFVSKLFKILLNGTYIAIFLFANNFLSFWRPGGRVLQANGWFSMFWLGRLHGSAPYFCCYKSFSKIDKVILSHRRNCQKAWRYCHKNKEARDPTELSQFKDIISSFNMQKHINNKKRKPNKPGREYGEQPLFKEFLRTGSRWPRLKIRPKMR